MNSLARLWNSNGAEFFFKSPQKRWLQLLWLPYHQGKGKRRKKHLNHQGYGAEKPPKLESAVEYQLCSWLHHLVGWRIIRFSLSNRFDLVFVCMRWSAAGGHSLSSFSFSTWDEWSLLVASLCLLPADSVWRVNLTRHSSEVMENKLATGRARLFPLWGWIERTHSAIICNKGRDEMLTSSGGWTPLFLRP